MITLTLTQQKIHLWHILSAFVAGATIILQFTLALIVITYDSVCRDVLCAPENAIQCAASLETLPFCSCGPGGDLHSCWNRTTYTSAAATVRDFHDGTVAMAGIGISLIAICEIWRSSWSVCAMLNCDFLTSGHCKNHRLSSWEYDSTFGCLALCLNPHILRRGIPLSAAGAFTSLLLDGFFIGLVFQLHAVLNTQSLNSWPALHIAIFTANVCDIFRCALRIYASNAIVCFGHQPFVPQPLSAPAPAPPPY